MVGSPWESSNVLVPAARPKMPRRDYEFRQGRLRRAYEFSPSASGELRNSTRTCLDAGSVFSLHVGATRAHTRSSARCGDRRAQHVPRCNRGPTICVHACMLRHRAAESPPDSCCRQLLSSASHCRDGDMAFDAHGHLMLVIATSRVPRRAYACHMHLPRRDDEIPTENTTTCWRLLPTHKCRDEIMSSTRHSCGERMSSRRQVPVASF